MMNRGQWLLLKLAEECAEVTQRVTKALTFGITEVQDGQDRNNSQRIVEELMDLHVILDKLSTEGYIDLENIDNLKQRIDQRSKKVERWYEYAKKEGQVQ